MASKIEQWTKDILPQHEAMTQTYLSLSPRELPIVACAVLDVALAELLHRRLVANEKQCQSFLGLSGDGTSPCGSFGARIQLALLTGIIDQTDETVLKSFKQIRNLFAHRVNIGFESPDVKKEVRKLVDASAQIVEKAAEEGILKTSVSEIATSERIEENPDTSKELIYVMFLLYHAYFSKVASSVVRLTYHRPKL